MRTVMFLLLLSCGTIPAQQLPAGTVLPVMLSSSLDARHARAGEPVTGRIMQRVPLPGGRTIPRNTKIFGHIVRARPAEGAMPSKLAVTFDRIEMNGRTLPIAVSLRALASRNEVFEARMPTNAWDDFGTSPSDWNTVQIGGAGVYRGSGEVVSGNEIVGRATDYGAVTAKLLAAPDRGCPAGSAAEQALWKFSPWACGAYGLGDLRILPPQDASDTGAIVLESARNVRIDGGSGWLLRINPAAEHAFP